jgi:hypothetical protein
MARSERQVVGTRAGVGTMTRSGARPRPAQAPEGAPAAPEPRRGRQPRPVPPPRPATDQRVPPPAAAAQRRGGPQAAAAPARPAARPRIGAPWRVAPAKRATGPQPSRTTGPQPSVRATGPQPSVPAAPPGAQRVAPLQAARAGLAGSHRMPFVLLLCGLLGGALVSALVISTTLAEGSFQINKLQDSTSSLARQRQTLEDLVAQSQSAQVIEQRASKLGMRRPAELQFLDLKTGKTSNDGPAWTGAANAPGYAP